MNHPMITEIERTGYPAALQSALSHFAPRKFEYDTDACECEEYEAVVKINGKRYCESCAKDLFNVEVL